MQETTLCLVMKDEPLQLLLGMKKRGFGQGKFNGFGGKVKPGETIEQAAVRELKEECAIKAEESQLELVGYIDFIFSASPELNHPVHIFVVRQWQGEPKETEEMKPQWFTTNQIPYEQMWQDDRYWLPAVLNRKKIAGKVVFSADNESIDEMEWQIEE